MAAWLSAGFANLSAFFGGEHLVADTKLPNGQNPQTGSVSLLTLAAAMALFSTTTSHATVAGTRYYSSIDINAAAPSAQDGGADQLAPIVTLTGVQLLLGATGGTDDWIVELHDVNGVLLATSATAGTLAGTAATWQQIAFTAPISIAPGTYYLVLQSNGTTAKFGAVNFPTPAIATTPLITGSVAGTFGTGANFTPATTYTQGLGPLALPY